MKNLYWTKIPDTQISSTVWKKIDDSSISIDQDTLLEQFSNEPKPSSAPSQPTTPVPAAPKTVDLIDSNKSRSVVILISRFKMGYSEIANNIKTINVNAFSDDQITGLLATLPTPDEIAAVNGYDGDKSLLGKCELFFLEIQSIHNLQIHLSLMLLIKTFDTQIQAIEPPIKVLRETFTMLQESKKLKQVFAIILRVGNFLNGGSTRGGVCGFKLESLTKLRDVKSASSQYTLLHYVVELIEKEFPECSDLSYENGLLSQSFNVDLDSLLKSLQSLSGSFTKCQRFMTQADKLVVEGDLFHPKFLEFSQANEQRVENCRSELDVIMKTSQDIIIMFGEIPEKVKLAEVIGALSSFTSDFLRAKDEVEKQRIKKEKEAQRELSKKATATPSSNAKRGVLDEMMSSLEDGTKLNRLRQVRPKGEPISQPVVSEPNNLKEAMEKIRRKSEK